jgi:hypothetical protein
VGDHLKHLTHAVLGVDIALKLNDSRERIALLAGQFDALDIVGKGSHNSDLTDP